MTSVSFQGVDKFAVPRKKPFQRSVHRWLLKSRDGVGGASPNSVDSVGLVDCATRSGLLQLTFSTSVYVRRYNTTDGKPSPVSTAPALQIRMESRDRTKSETFCCTTIAALSRQLFLSAHFPSSATWLPKIFVQNQSGVRFFISLALPFVARLQSKG